MSEKADKIRKEAESRGATPETASKLRRDVFSRLRERRRITSEQYAAGEEIYKIKRLLCKGLYPDGREFLQVRVDESFGNFMDPFDRMAEAEELLWLKHYRPWHHWAAKMQVGCATLEGLTHLIITDNFSCRETERMVKRRNGSAIRDLIRSLDQYIFYTHCTLTGHKNHANFQST
jgi:hypothetical protein